MPPTFCAFYDLPIVSLQCVFHCLDTKKAAIGEKVASLQNRWNDLSHLGAGAPADAALPLLGHMLAAPQLNIPGRHLANADGYSYLRIPVGKFDPR